jgi:hypothetical protein
MRLRGLLAVPGADLLEMRAVDLGRLGHIAVRPDEDPLRAHVHVDAGVVPAQHPADRRRRMHVLRPRQLLLRLAEVAVGVCVEVALVDFGHALDEYLDAAFDPRPGRV